MTNPYDKNKAISADEAAKIIPRAEFRVFGKDIISGVQEHMWKCKATLYKMILQLHRKLNVSVPHYSGLSALRF